MQEIRSENRSRSTAVSSEEEFIPLLDALREKERELVVLRSSTLWRVTAPLRWLLDRLRGRHRRWQKPVIPL